VCVYVCVCGKIEVGIDRIKVGLLYTSLLVGRSDGCGGGGHDRIDTHLVGGHDVADYFVLLVRIVTLI
jgi:hypothetical protein